MAGTRLFSPTTGEHAEYGTGGWDGRMGREERVPIAKKEDGTRHEGNGVARPTTVLPLSNTRMIRMIRLFTVQKIGNGKRRTCCARVRGAVPFTLIKSVSKIVIDRPPIVSTNAARCLTRPCYCCRILARSTFDTGMRSFSASLSGVADSCRWCVRLCGVRPLFLRGAQAAVLRAHGGCDWLGEAAGGDRDGDARGHR